MQGTTDDGSLSGLWGLTALPAELTGVNGAAGVIGMASVVGVRDAGAFAHEIRLLLLPLKSADCAVGSNAGVGKEGTESAVSKSPRCAVTVVVAVPIVVESAEIVKGKDSERGRYSNGLCPE